MANNIAGFGISVRIRASNTFPSGLLVTQFADDSDPLDVPSLEIANSAMGVNGHKVVWATANIIPMTLNIIPGSEDDKNLQALFEANRVGRNKAGAKDEITAIVTYSDGSRTTLTAGSCDAFVPTNAVSSEGRFKTKPYLFSFENRIAT